MFLDDFLDAQCCTVWCVSPRPVAELRGTLNPRPKLSQNETPEHGVFCSLCGSRVRLDGSGSNCNSIWTI